MKPKLISSRHPAPRDSDSRFLPQPIVIPPYLECGICKTCDEITPLVTAFNAGCSDPTNYDERLARYLNRQLGFSLLPEAYADFLEKCGANPFPTTCSNSLQLCPSTPFDKGEVGDNCLVGLMNQIKAQALFAYEEQLDELRETFINEYLNACLGSTSEIFEVETETSEYQYTLYYFDQAGNLVKTIPPKGVVLNNGPTFLADAAAYRNGEAGATKQLPAHAMPTVYVYNSLNQVILEDTPDANPKQFWYDRLGRLVASQDGRQALPRNYSYSLYDDLGRIIEAGEVVGVSVNSPLTNTIAMDDALFASWLENEEQFMVSRTFYDEDAFDFPAYQPPLFDPSEARNLRNRVVATAAYDIKFGGQQYPILEYTSAAHYSYDVVGNVKTLVQPLSDLIYILC